MEVSLKNKLINYFNYGLNLQNSQCQLAYQIFNEVLTQFILVQKNYNRLYNKICFFTHKTLFKNEFNEFNDDSDEELIDTDDEDTANIERFNDNCTNNNYLFSENGIVC